MEIEREQMTTFASTSVLANVESFKKFLQTHPVSKKVFSCEDVGGSQKMKRVRAMRVGIQKLVEERGLYPRKEDKISLARVLGQLFNQRPSVFFDETTSKGLIAYTLKKRRHKVPLKLRIKQMLNKGTPDFGKGVVLWRNVEAVGDNDIPTSRLNQDSTTSTESVFRDLKSCHNFLMNHHKSRQVLKSDADIDPMKKQKIVVSVAVRKLVKEYGLYPNCMKLIQLSQLLGQVLDKPPLALYNRKSCTGSIFMALKYCRKKIPANERRLFTPKVFIHDTLEGTSESQTNAGEMALEAIDPLACSDCGKVFKRRSGLNKHRKNVHGHGSSFVCRRCKEEFLSKSELMRHNERCAAEYKKLRLEERRTCKICVTVMPTIESLVAHFQICHPDEAPFECLKCGEEFSKAPDIRYHICKKGISFICEKCGEALTSKTLLASHMFRFHVAQKTFVCTHCNKSFICKGALEHHLATNHGRIERIICTVCGHLASGKSSLRIHMLQHKTEKPYACQFCERKFSYPSGFHAHLRTHTGEKPWKCDICGWCFADGHNLKTHIRTHTGEKPYECETCHKTFAQHSAMKQHSKQH